MILAESSIWIDHLRARNAHLAALLRDGRVAMHSMVIGELACGSLKDRAAVLDEWRTLPRIDSVSDEEAIDFVEDARLMGRGVGFVDVHLLAAVASKPGSRLWSRDRRLAEIAANMRLVYLPQDA